MGMQAGGSVRAVTALVAAVLGITLLASCAPEPPAVRPAGAGPARYVALGDSSAAGPFTGPHIGPFGCFRSSVNYPHLVAAALDVRTFVDVSCGNAVLEHLTEPQQTEQFGIPTGEVPAQLDVLTADTELVTISMGGNDVKLPDVVLGCVNLLTIPLGPPPFGQSCIPKYVQNGVDAFDANIDAARTRYLDALSEIRRRAPRARVLVVGYMAAFPQGDRGCWPVVPALDQDVVYARQKLEAMNQMIEDVASAAGAEYVDIYEPSRGHDVCQDGATRWMNFLQHDSPGFVAHPNALAHRAFARTVVDAVRQG